MNIAIILSGGVGTRMGSSMPKQYIEVNNKPILLYCLEVFAKHKDIDGFVIGVADEWKDYVQKIARGIDKPILYSPTGLTRQYTVFNALKTARENGYAYDDIVIIHDAVRPFVSESIISACISGVEEGYDGVMPVLRMKDTLYRSVDGVSITALIDRSEIYAGQAPECFRLGKYLDVLYKMSEVELLAVTGSTQIAYMNNFNIRLVEGSEENFKITTPEDLERFRQLQK